MKNLHFKFKSLDGDIIFDLHIKSKYTLLIGKSASFKTELTRSIAELQKNVRDTQDAHIVQNIIVVQNIYIDRLLNFRELCKNNHEDELYILDEDTIDTLRVCNKLKDLQKLRCHLMLIYRDAVPNVHVHYKDYMRLVKNDNTITLQRKYPDLDNWIRSQYYVIADSGSGLQYFTTRCPNIISAQGRDNLYTLRKDGVILADGAAISQVFPTLYNAGVKMVLYDCFEALIIKYLSEDFYNNKGSNCSIRFANFEQYFESFINNMGYSFKYSKKSLPMEIYDYDLVDGLHRIKEIPDRQLLKEYNKKFALLFENNRWDRYMKRLNPAQRWQVYERLQEYTEGDFEVWILTNFDFW